MLCQTAASPPLSRGGDFLMLVGPHDVGLSILSLFFNALKRVGPILGHSLIETLRHARPYVHGAIPPSHQPVQPIAVRTALSALQTFGAGPPRSGQHGADSASAGSGSGKPYRSMQRWPAWPPPAPRMSRLPSRARRIARSGRLGPPTAWPWVMPPPCARPNTAASGAHPRWRSDGWLNAGRG